MKDLELTKDTMLQTAIAVDIPNILDFKIKEYKEQGLPVEQRLCDYIAISMQNIDTKIDTLSSYKKELDIAIKRLKSDKKNISKEVYNYISNNLGVSKLSGAVVSSITLKDESVSVSKRFVLDVDKDELVEKNLAHYEEDIREIPAGIKINKRRSNENK